MGIVVSHDNSAVKRIFETVKSTAKKNSPELLVVTGTIAFVATLWSMHKTTLKTKDIVDKANEEITVIKETKELRQVDGTDNIEYTEEDKAEDIKKVKRISAGKIVKAAAPTVLLAIGTLGCFFGADYIRRQRHAALFAAAEMTLHSYNNYRKGVIDRYGPEVDKELKYKLFKDTEEVEETDQKTGKKKTVKKKVTRTNYDGYSDFARVFDEFNEEYNKNIFYSNKEGKDVPYGLKNLEFVIEMEKAANQKLRKQGNLTINEVYEMLRFDKVPAGSVAGWIFDINDKTCLDDCHVDFGIFDKDTAELKAIMLGNEKSFVLDFNIDTLDIWEGFDEKSVRGLLPGRS